MKKLTLTLMLLLSAMSLAAAEQCDFELDGLKYQFSPDADNEVCIVGYTGYDQYCAAHDLVIPAQVTHDGNEYQVTSIANAAFCGIRARTVDIPKTIRRIGESAFVMSDVYHLKLDGDMMSIGGYPFGMERNSLLVVELSGSFVFERPSRTFQDDPPYIPLYSPCVALSGDVQLMDADPSRPAFAFLSCQDLFIDDSVDDITGIRVRVLKNCYSYRPTPPATDDATFCSEVPSNITLHVAQSAVSAYFQATAWNLFKNIKGDANAQLENITLNASELVMTPGETFTLKALLSPDEIEGVYMVDGFESYVVSFNSSGSLTDEIQLTANQDGETLLVAYWGDQIAFCHVQVTSAPVPPPTITVTPGEVTMDVDEIVTLTASVEGGNNVEFVWESDKDDIVFLRTVDSHTVQVLGLAPGQATITVRDVESQFTPGICQIRVNGSVGAADTNGDGKIDIADVNLVINAMLGKAAGDVQLTACDITGDGHVDIADVNAVINAMLGLE